MKIFLIGFMGSGKTYFGKKLSQKINLPFFDLDELIEQHEQKSIVELFDSKGENYFRTIEKNILHDFAEANESFVLSTGGGTPCFFDSINYMNLCGISIWINTPTDILFDRLSKGKSKRPLIKNLTPSQLKVFINSKIAERKLVYEKANYVINESDIDFEKIVKLICNE